MPLLWMAFSVVILIFPADIGPVAANMNYTIVVLRGWIILCVIYYYFPVWGGVNWFKGPVVTLEQDVASSTSASDEEKYAPSS